MSVYIQLSTAHAVGTVLFRTIWVIFFQSERLLIHEWPWQIRHTMCPLRCYRADFERFSFVRSIFQHRVYAFAFFCFPLYHVCVLDQSSKKQACALLGMNC